MLSKNFSIEIFYLFYSDFSRNTYHVTRNKNFDTCYVLREMYVLFIGEIIGLNLFYAFNRSFSQRLP